MTECQGCGAWNERHRTLCVLCGTPLAEADEWDLTAELPPLPPLPDGGLSVSMPAWLRAVPDAPEPGLVQAAALPIPEEAVVAATMPAERVVAVDEPDLVLVADSGEQEPEEGGTPGDQPLGPEADPRTFLSDEDFPRWIRELPVLPPRPVVQSSAPIAPVLATELQSTPAAPSPDRDIPSTARADLAVLEQEALQQERHGSAEPASSPPALPASAPPVTPPDLPRRREPWEAPLMVVLVVGVVAAVIWALLANGLIGSGL